MHRQVWWPIHYKSLIGVSTGLTGPSTFNPNNLTKQVHLSCKRAPQVRRFPIALQYEMQGATGFEGIASYPDHQSMRYRMPGDNFLKTHQTKRYRMLTDCFLPRLCRARRNDGGMGGQGSTQWRLRRHCVDPPFYGARHCDPGEARPGRSNP